MSHQALKMIQLPNDAVSVGYRKVGEFKYAQVFKSELSNFEGTEVEFVSRGLAYEYVEIDEYRRRVI